MDVVPVNRPSKSSRSSKLASVSRLLSFSTSVAVSFSASVNLAIHTLKRVLRNSLLFMAVGWIFGYFFTLGNVFTGLPPSQQSYAAFSAANISWFWGVFSACMIIIMSTKLLREQFVVCSVKRPILYISAFWGFYSMAIADAYVRHIFQMETNSKRFWTPSPCRILHIYRQNGPVVIFALVAI
eukprot:jgi/Phyca11/115309/e_gw1.28.503.1